MNKQILLLIVVLLLLSACSSAEPEQIEVTRLVEIAAAPVEVTRIVEVITDPEIVEVTRIVEMEVTRIVEVTAVPTNTPRPSPTPEESIEEVRARIVGALLDLLQAQTDVERVDLITLKGDGIIGVELTTIWASKDSQPDVSWDIVVLLSEAMADMSAARRITLTGEDNFVFSLLTRSTQGNYPYGSETDFETMVGVNQRTISRSQWEELANAGFR